MHVIFELLTYTKLNFSVVLELLLNFENASNHLVI